MTLQKINESPRQANFERFKDVGPASVANAATWTVTLPELIALSGLPLVDAVVHYPAGGNVGARVAVYLTPVIDAPTANEGIVVEGYDEATGILTLRNESNAALVNPEVYMTVITTSADGGI